jgi:hypothetical protein
VRKLRFSSQERDELRECGLVVELVVVLLKEVRERPVFDGLVGMRGRERGVGFSCRDDLSLLDVFLRMQTDLG